MKKWMWLLAFVAVTIVGTIARLRAPDHLTAHPDGTSCRWYPAEVIIGEDGMMCLSCAQEWAIEYNWDEVQLFNEN